MCDVPRCQHPSTLIFMQKAVCDRCWTRYCDESKPWDMRGLLGLPPLATAPVAPARPVVKPPKLFTRIITEDRPKPKVKPPKLVTPPVAEVTPAP